MSEKSETQVAFSTSQIYKYYFDLAQMFSGRGLKILKTDSHNESGVYPQSIPLMPVLSRGNHAQCVEIDEIILGLAKLNYPELRFMLGDIRALTVDGGFDVVLDFSTIDHVSRGEVEQVLREYRRVAAFSSIIVWHSDSRQDSVDQTYIPRQDFIQKIAQVFGSEAISVLLYSDRDRELVHYLVGAGPVAEIVSEVIDLGKWSRTANKEHAALWRLKTSLVVQMALKISPIRALLTLVYRKLST